MAQSSRQIQTQAQQQVQTLSPQQILVVKLLELPAVELEDRVRAELLENPALEEGREETHGEEEDVRTADESTISEEDGGDTDYDSLSDYLNEDDIPDYKLQENNRSRDEQAEEIPFSDSTSFYETLKEQLGERNLTPHQRELTEYLIGSLDDDGLLRKPLDSIANHKVLEYMRTAPVTTKWLDELALHAMMLSGGYGKADSALVYELYSRLTPEDLKTRQGEVISATLSPRKVVGVGDGLVDGDLYDTDGNVHHLSEFSGKYILLDFWSLGCGPCMESIPEGNELAREFADRLAFVRLSVDGEKTWKKVLKKVLKEEKSDCVEWNEFKPMGAGLSASYQVNGIPHFVLISPEAKVIDIWTGYGKGSLRSRLLRHLGSE